MFTIQLLILITATIEILFSLLYPSSCTRINNCLFGFSPGALAKNLVEVHGHLVLGNQALHLCLDGRGEDPHDGLGGEPVLGPLLVVSLGNVTKHHVSGLVDVMDDFAEVTLEISGSQTLKISKSLWRNISLPLEVPLASVNHPS